MLLLVLPTTVPFALPVPPLPVRYHRWRHPQFDTYFRRAEAQHEEEIAANDAKWPIAAASDADAPHADVESFDARFAGPDAEALTGASMVHTTTSPLFSADECAAIRAEAADAMARGVESSFTYTRASGLGEAHVHEALLDAVHEANIITCLARAILNYYKQP